MRHKSHPSRAILAVKDNKTATATWQLNNGQWFCVSASKYLKWMRGMRDVLQAKNELGRRGFKASWIVPCIARTPIEPPFEF